MFVFHINLCVAPDEKWIPRLPAGTWVVYRNYESSEAVRLAEATKTVQLCRDNGHKVLIARDMDLAQAVGADGLVRITLLIVLFFFFFFGGEGVVLLSPRPS